MYDDLELDPEPSLSPYGRSLVTSIHDSEEAIENGVPRNQSDLEELRPESLSLLSGLAGSNGSTISVHHSGPHLGPSQAPNNTSQYQSVSWQLILFVAPTTIVLLVWFLNLLSRRRKQLIISSLGKHRNLVLASSSSPNPKNSVDLNNQQHQHLLTSSLSSKSSGSSTIDSARSNSSSTGDRDLSFVQLHSNSLEVLLGQTDQMLLAQTYQEIVACLVAFMVAILNVVRMRNLFCCNLVLFLLVSSKLLSLLSLALFSTTKLFGLIRFQPSTILLGRCKREQSSEISSRKIHSNQTSSSMGSNSSSSQHHGRGSDVNTTTICRLIDKSDRGQSGSRLHHKQENHRSRARHSSSLGFRFQPSSHRPESKSRLQNLPINHIELKRSRLKFSLSAVLLALVSSLLALICIYLRLMSNDPTSQSQIQAFLPPSNGNSNRSQASDSIDWQLFSIYPTSSTTEASLRYSSDSDGRPDTTTAPPDSTTSSSQAISWPSRLQPAARLKQLAEYYELSAFFNILLDTRTQTSRFICTLSSGFYSPTAKLYNFIIYSALTSLLIINLLVMQQLGNKKLREIKRILATHSYFTPPTYATSDRDEEVGLEDDDSSTCDNSSESRPNLDRKQIRYSELLRRHQSSLGVDLSRSRRSSAGQIQAPPRASSMCSLLQPHQARGVVQRLLSQQQQSNVKKRNRRAPGYSSNELDERIRRQTSHSMHELELGGSQLAWLPFGSAATVASLSNLQLDCDEPSKMKSRARQAEASCRLCPIGEHRTSSFVDLEATVDDARRVQKPSSSSEVERSKTPQGSDIRSLLSHLELSSDLRLSRLVILYGQLMHHAPISVSRADRCPRFASFLFFSSFRSVSFATRLTGACSSVERTQWPPARDRVHSASTEVGRSYDHNAAFEAGVELRNDLHLGLFQFSLQF